MKSLRQFSAILLLLVSCVAPTMACMAADAQMTTDERACCRMMKNRCGQMGMPASHGCCTKAPKSLHESALKTDTVSLHPMVFTAVCIASFEFLAPQEAGYGWVQHLEHSPPKFPPSAITILRI